jgi:hypothetical protein
VIELLLGAGAAIPDEVEGISSAELLADLGVGGPGGAVSA